MILVIDNYDSFTFNLVQALGARGAELVVRRNDAVDADGVRAMAPAGIVMSPGPGRPEDAGCCLELVRALDGEVPMLGVCLGHQAIAQALGASVTGAPEIVHGKTSDVTHDGSGIFAGLSSPLTATRYHSLVVAPDEVPAELVVNATGPGGLVMGLRHRSLPLHGVQFHPESIATPDGDRLLENFLVAAREVEAMPC